MEEKLLALIESLKVRKYECGADSKYEAAFEAYEYAVTELENILGESRVCKDCGSYFELSDRELAFYQRNKLFLPKRCPYCREARKSTKKSEAIVATGLITE